MNYLNYLHLPGSIFKCRLMQQGLGKSYPYKLNLAITYSCNSKCRTCGIWKLYREKPSQQRYEMTLEEYQHLFDSLPNLLWLHLSGGEPFLRRDFVDIASYATQRFKSLAIMDVSTNGLLASQVEKTIYEILQNKKCPYLVVGVSLDGVRTLHDFVRGIEGGWYRSIETYKKLCEIAKTHNNFYAHINYTISTFNAGKISEFLEDLQNNGIIVKASDISVSLAHIGSSFLNQEKGFDAIRLVGDTTSKAEDDIKYLLKNTKINIGQLPKLRARPLFKRIFLYLAMNYLSNPARMVIPCAAGSASCFIDPYGQVYPCTIMAEKMGDLKEMKFDEIWFSEKAFRIRERIKAGVCPNCWSGCESSQSILQYLPRLRDIRSHESMDLEKSVKF